MDTLMEGFVSILAALLLFSLLLLMPVIATGSWQSVELMWRENVLRFVKPFDHVEPPYAYLYHSLSSFSPGPFCFSLFMGGKKMACLLVAPLDIARWHCRLPLFYRIRIQKELLYTPLVPALPLLQESFI